MVDQSLVHVGVRLNEQFIDLLGVVGLVEVSQHIGHAQTSESIPQVMRKHVQVLSIGLPKQLVLLLLTPIASYGISKGNSQFNSTSIQL